MVSKKRKLSKKGLAAIRKAQRARWAKVRATTDQVVETSSGAQNVTAHVHIPSGRIVVVPEKVNHPAHYGGDTAYEVIKVLEAWEIGTFSETSGFNLGNAIKYIARSNRKDDYIDDLRKAAWYLNREIENANS